MRKINSFIAIQFVILFFFSKELNAQIRYIDEVFSSVTKQSNLLYDSNYSINLLYGKTGLPANYTNTPYFMDYNYCDLYSPTGDASNKRPLVILIHTGTFMPSFINGHPTGSKDDSSIVEISQKMAKRGYLVAAINYRLGWNQNTQIQEQATEQYLKAIYRAMQDTRRAIQYFRKNAITYGIDTSKIAVGGQGQGGMVSLALATVSKRQDLELRVKFMRSNATQMVNIDTMGDWTGSGGLTPYNLTSNSSFSCDYKISFDFGGAMCDTSWMKPISKPIISMHCSRDPFLPYNTGNIVFPASALTLISNASGGADVVPKANSIGLNNIINNYGIFNDSVSIRSMQIPGASNNFFGFETTYPADAPWEWWDTTVAINTTTWTYRGLNLPLGSGGGRTANNNGLLTNPYMSSLRARLYCDTIVRFICPRLAAQFGFIEASRMNYLLTDSLVAFKKDSVLLDGGFGYLKYKWNTGENTRYIWAKNTGFYSLTVDSILVRGYDSIYVFLIKGIQQKDTTLCRGNAINLKVLNQNSVKFAWSTNDTNVTINVNPITDSIFRCVFNLGNLTFTDSIKITLRNLPNNTVTVSKPMLCIGDSTIIVASVGYHYKWYKDNFQITDTTFSLKTNQIGKYQVIIKDNFGCSNISDTIKISNSSKIVAKVNITNDKMCLNNNLFNLLDSTTIDSGSYSRLWTFASGDTSTLINPTKKYLYAGLYTIKLAVTSYFGCKDSVTKTIAVYPNTNLGFKVNSASQCINGNSFLFTDTSNLSSGTYTRVWNFGDGVTATTNTYTKNYAATNTYLVKLMTTTNNGCKDSITKTVTVNPKPSAGFTSNTANQCLKTNSYSFADTSKIASGAINRLWTLGNGDTTSLINTNKVFSNAGTYAIKLLATSDNGCKDSITKSVIVYPNTNIGFKINNAIQCVNGNSFLYTDTSSISSGTYTRLWNFGDFTNSSISPFTKSYFNANTYQVKLVTTSNNACKDSITKTVVVNPKPDVYFMNLNPSQCLKGNHFSFADSSFIGSGSMSRTWYLGDGSTDTNLVANKKYNQANTYHIKLVVSSNNTCKDSMTSDVIVNPQPISNATAQGRTIVCPSEIVNIKASTSNGNTYQWLKNEVPLPSSTDSVLLTSAHGIYNVITSTAFACADTSQGIIIVVNPLPKANLGINNSAQCLAGNQFQFTDSSTIASGSLQRLWYINNVLNDTAFNIRKSYSSDGKYNVKLVSISETNCKDSITKTITVHPQPTPDFDINNPSQCLIPNSFVFTDVSTIKSGNITRTWDTGNANKDTTVFKTQIYNNIGNHTVKLVCKSDKSCTDSISKTITVIANPVVGIILGQTKSIATSTPYIYSVAQQLNHSYLWSTANGIVVAGQGTNVATVQWIGIGIGNIKVVITSPQGCNDTSLLSLNITSTGINELQSISQLELYPNPNNGDFKLKITITKSTTTRFSLLNMLGQEVWTDSRNLSAGAQEMDLTTNVAAGVYLLRVQNEYGQVQKSVVIR